MKKYKIAFHVLPEGSVLTGARRQETVVEAESARAARAALLETHPDARISSVEAAEG